MGRWLPSGFPYQDLPSITVVQYRLEDQVMDRSEWERKGEGIQQRLNEVDEQWRQARIDGDKKEAKRLEVLWHELDEELRAHMKEQPS